MCQSPVNVLRYKEISSWCLVKWPGPCPSLPDGLFETAPPTTTAWHPRVIVNRYLKSTSWIEKGQPHFGKADLYHGLRAGKCLIFSFLGENQEGSSEENNSQVTLPSGMKRTWMAKFEGRSSNQLAIFCYFASRRPIARLPTTKALSRAIVSESFLNPRYRPGLEPEAFFGHAYDFASNGQ